jgi:hypothetical protein
MKITTKIKKDDFIFICLTILLILIAGFRPIGLDADSSNYAAFVKSSGSSMSILTKEPGFWFLTKINQYVFGGNLTSFFLLFAIVGVSVKAYAIRKLSPYPLYALYAYVCLYFILHEMTQIRVAIAAGIFLIAIPDIFNKNLKGYVFKVFIACMFHYSAIIMLFVYPLQNKRVNRVFYFSLPLVGIFLAFNSSLLLSFLSNNINFLPILVSVKIQLYIDLLLDGSRAGLNLFNFYYSTVILFYYVLFFNVKKFKFTYDVICFKILSFSLFSFYALSFLPVLSFRIAEFYGVVIILLFSNFHSLFKNKRLIFCFTSAWLLAYFVLITLMKNLNA